MRARPSVGLTARQGRRCGRHRRTVLNQWPRGLLHFLKGRRRSANLGLGRLLCHLASRGKIMVGLGSGPSEGEGSVLWMRPLPATWDMFRIRPTTVETITNYALRLVLLVAVGLGTDRRVFVRRKTGGERRDNSWQEPQTRNNILGRAPNPGCVWEGW